MKDCIEKGYENQMLIRFMKEKGIAARANLSPIPHLNSSTLAIIAAIEKLNRNAQTITVIDFGGASGGHYLAVRPQIDKNIQLNWYVIETPALVAAFQAFETEELHFSSDLTRTLQSLSQVDLVHTSGTLQYTPEPYTFLQQLCEVKAMYKIFNRQSLNTADETLISVQRSLLSWHGQINANESFKDAEIRYPHTNMSVSEFERIIVQRHKILFTYDDATGIKKVNRMPIIGKSYCVKAI
jgi:putative methyltransferase (TIGR04325 family)